jgi:hypothetical protein
MIDDKVGVSFIVVVVVSGVEMGMSKECSRDSITVRARGGEGDRSGRTR